MNRKEKQIKGAGVKFFPLPKKIRGPFFDNASQHQLTSYSTVELVPWTARTTCNQAGAELYILYTKRSLENIMVCCCF